MSRKYFELDQATNVLTAAEVAASDERLYEVEEVYYEYLCTTQVISYYEHQVFSREGFV